MDLRAASRRSWLTGARHGLVPIRNGHDGQLRAMQERTSPGCPAQQSRQCARIAASGEVGSWPSARRSACDILRGSRPMRSTTPSTTRVSVPPAGLVAVLMIEAPSLAGKLRRGLCGASSAYRRAAKSWKCGAPLWMGPIPDSEAGPSHGWGWGRFLLTPSRRRWVHVWGRRIRPALH